jgi:hypothetical protein
MDKSKRIKVVLLLNSSVTLSLTLFGAITKLNPVYNGFHLNLSAHVSTENK